MLPKSNEQLPESYYLDNFRFLLEFVFKTYSPLLSVGEKSFYMRFKGLSNDTSRLYVRLANRKGSYFRCDKIDYSEILNTPTAINELVFFGLAQYSIPDFDNATKLCAKRELKSIPDLRDWPSGAKKADMISLLAESKSINPIKELRIPVIELLGLTELKIFKLLFFGNFQQDMKTFVLHEMVAPFEDYDLSNDTNSINL